MNKHKAKSIKKQERDFVKEYNELVAKMHQLIQIEREWNRKGDHFHKCSLFEDSPTPILTNNTFQIYY